MKTKECSMVSLEPKSNQLLDESDRELIRLYDQKPVEVLRLVRSLYNELSTFKDFEKPCDFVLDMFPGLTTVYQYSELKCLNLDIIEPLGDRLLTFNGNSYARDIIGGSAFQYHMVPDTLPKMMYNRIVSSETHKFRGYPMLDNGIDSLRIGGKLYLFGLELNDQRLLVTGTSNRFTEYLRIR